MLALCKPAGVLSQADRTGEPDVITLVGAWLKEKYSKPGNVYVGLVHRLDKPVSGAMVLARTSKAARRMSVAFKSRTVKKKYVAVVEGHMTGNGTMEDYLRKVTRPVRAVVDRQHGKYAQLHWQALTHVGGHTVVVVDLITGRPHQIRCQFAHRGFPLAGDERYGARHALAGIPLALHCRTLALPHPVRRDTLEISAPLPQSWLTFDDALNSL